MFVWWVTIQPAGVTGRGERVAVAGWRHFRLVATKQKALVLSEKGRRTRPAMEAIALTA